MSEIEQYLAQIRSSLDVSPARAEEIIAEARCHLEARVREFAAKGMSREEAVAEAVRGFGEPEAVAAELRKANSKHRDVSRFRLLLAIGIAFGSTLSAISHVHPLLPQSAAMSIAYGKTLSAVWFLGRLHAGAPLWLPRVIEAMLRALVVWVPVFALPGAVLAGMVAGRRYWWVAATPPLLFMALCWTASLVEWALVPYRDQQLMWALAWPLLAAAAFAMCGYLGARVGEGRRLRYPIGVLCAVCVLGISVPALAQAVRNLKDLVLAIAVAQGASCILLVAAHREKLVGPRVLIAAGAGMAALVGAMGVAVLAWPRGLDTFSGEGRIAFIVSLAVVVYLPAALVWLGWKGRKVSEGAQAVGGRPSRGT